MLLELIDAYTALARLEWASEQRRLRRLAISAGIGLLALALGLAFAGVALIIMHWDSPMRIIVAWLVTLAYLLTALVCAAICIRAQRASASRAIRLAGGALRALTLAASVHRLLVANRRAPDR